jgi:REP element-mobilizing transposase RayT
MTRPRKTLISLDTTPYYHITTRCVRRAFLCGVDRYSGKNYEHRRQWIVDRLRLLSSLFAIDICAYAVMSNHYHLVLKLCPEQLSGVSNDEIIERWCALFKGPLLVQRYRQGISLSPIERNTVNDIVAVWRNKLSDLSWFMRCLNQPIAFQANREDDCTGKFWESRFTSQALTTEEALLSCMTYVELNPIRANMAESPETSDYTSIKERLRPTFNLTEAIKAQSNQGELRYFSVPLKPLLPFDQFQSNCHQQGIPLAFDAYLELVDWTGRAIRADKSGAIDSRLPPIMERLRLSSKQWLINTTQFEAIHRWRFNRQSPVSIVC